MFGGLVWEEEEEVISSPTSLVLTLTLVGIGALETIIKVYFIIGANSCS